MIRVIHHFSSVSNGWDGQLDLEVRCYWYCKVGPYDRCKCDCGVPTKWPSKLCNYISYNWFLVPLCVDRSEIWLTS